MNSSTKGRPIAIFIFAVAVAFLAAVGATPLSAQELPSGTVDRESFAAFYADRLAVPVEEVAETADDMIERMT